MIDPSAFNATAAAFFKRLVKAVDGADPDLVECDSTGDMVTITAVTSGEKIVVNTQRAVNQIWVAGKGVGVHFSMADDGRWLDDKQKGLELTAWIVECVEAASGQRLAL
jgi:CyaY protein